MTPAGEWQGTTRYTMFPGVLGDVEWSALCAALARGWLGVLRTAAGARLLTRPELAAAFGVHPITVTKWEQAGLPIAERGSRGRASRYSLKDVMDWRVRRELRAHGIGDESNGRLDPLAERALLDRARRKEVEHRLAVQRGEYVGVAEVEGRWLAIVTAVRERMLSLPATALQRGIIRPDREDDLIGLVDEALAELGRGVGDATLEDREENSAA